MPLSIDNLLVTIGVAYDLQLKASDNLFYASAVQVDDPSKPMFGGCVGTSSGAAVAVGAATAQGYYSINNGIEGDPVAIKQISTATGPQYKVVDGAGNEIMVNAASVGGAASTTPRYQVQSDGVIRDIVRVVGGVYTLDAGYNTPVGRITFKAKEGASLTRATDEQQRVGSLVQALTRLLESLQEESKSFAQIIR